MSLGFNEGKDMDTDSATSTIQKYTLKIKNAEETSITLKSGDKAEVIQFDFVGDESLFFVTKYQFTQKADGTYKKAVRDGFKGTDGTDVPPTLMWELKELIKAKLGIEGYTKRKEASGGITNKFFIGAEFDIDCKRVESKDKGAFYIPMFKDELAKEAEYKASKAPAVAEEKPFTDLPF